MEENKILELSRAERAGTCRGRASKVVLTNSRMGNHDRSSQEALDQDSRLSTETKFEFSRGVWILVCAVTWVLMSCISISNSGFAEALPFPVPNLQNCRSSEGCCTPALSPRTQKFQFPTDLPLRMRRAAQLVDDAYIAKYQRATELMRALPDTDGRSFLNQYKLHCAYCDKNLYYDDEDTGQGDGRGASYPLEIHGSWMFHPWHRLYIYFYERILAKLIDDDTFALPFWNWDNQAPGAPQGNVVPRVYGEARSLANGQYVNSTSSLYDPDRTPCAMLATGYVDFQNTSACPQHDQDQDAAAARATNGHVMNVHMVGVGVTPLLFHGFQYRFGDAGGGGGGAALEDVPHGSVHGWVNKIDMLGLKDSASDPILFRHHATVDRLWELWKTLKGGFRQDIADPYYLNTELAFYDEDGNIVTVSVAQALQLDQLRYTYEEVPNPWLHNNNRENVNICNRRNSEAERAALVEATQEFAGPVNFTRGQLTFRVRREPHRGSSSEAGEEMLELRGDVNYTALGFKAMVGMTAFAFHPTAQEEESLGCAEYLSARRVMAHVGMSPLYPSENVWRMGIRHQLRLLHADHLDFLVVTITASASNQHAIVFTSASVIYSDE